MNWMPDVFLWHAFVLVRVESEYLLVNSLEGYVGKWRTVEEYLNWFWR